MGRTIAEAVEARSAFRELPASIPASVRRDLEPLLRVDPDDRPRSLDYLIRDDPAVEIRGGHAAPQTSTPWGGGRLAVVAAIVVVVGVVWQFGGDSEVRSPAEVEAVLEQSASPEIVETEAAPEIPVRQTISAADRLKNRLKLQGMLGAAARALGENRLSTPAGDNAVERYRAVLELDPGNSTALAGLRKVGERYAALAEAALAKGDAARGAGLRPARARCGARTRGVARARRPALAMLARADEPDRAQSSLAGTTPVPVAIAIRCSSVRQASTFWPLRLASAIAYA